MSRLNSNRIRLLTGVCAVLLTVANAQAQSSAAAAQSSAPRDIERLTQRIERSPCSFVRNGTAYDGAKAAAHLRSKVRAAQRNITVDEFVEHIASKSSLSGQPYLIRCAGAPDEPSGAWLRRPQR